MLATLYRNYGVLAWILAGSLLAAACAGPTSKSPGSTTKSSLEATIAAFGRYGEFLIEPGAPMLAVEELIGTQFYGGAEDGPLPPVTVRHAIEGGCTRVMLELAPAHSSYIAYSKPAEFFALDQAPDLWTEVREKGLLGNGTEHVRVWRIATNAVTGGKVVAVAQSPRAWGNEEVAERLASDKVLLFEEDLGTLSLLDSGAWNTEPEGDPLTASILAAARNPFNDHLEIFVHLSRHDFSGVVAFDLSADTLQDRASYQCAH